MWGVRAKKRQAESKRGQELSDSEFSPCTPAEPVGSYTGVRSGALLFFFLFGDSKMNDKDGEIVFNTQAKHTQSEAVASGTPPPDSSDATMDAIMEALQWISSQNKGIELKIEQQDRKADLQIQEISERFENLGARVNNQAAEMESQLKLHGDKLAAKVNVFEEEFSNTVASLNAKHRSFEETVKTRLQKTQERLYLKLNAALQVFDGKLKEALDTRKSLHVKEETWTPMKLQMASPASILTPLLFPGVEPEHKRPIQKPPSFDEKSLWEPYIAQFEIVAGMNQWNDEQKGNYLATSLKGSALTVLGILATETRQDYKALVAALESRGAAHQQELHCTKFKNRLQHCEESLQELAEDIERLARLAYPLALEDMKDLLAKEQFIDAILDGDTQLRLKQSKRQSIRAALELALELESYRLASRQRDLHVREMSTAPMEETPTVPADGKKCQQEDVLAQVKVLLEEIRAPKGNMQSYSGTWMRDQLCWACGKRGHFRRDCYNFRRSTPRDMQPRPSQPPLN